MLFIAPYVLLCVKETSTIGRVLKAVRERFELSVQFNPYDGLANRSFRPLRHLSGSFFRLAKIAGKNQTPNSIFKSHQVGNPRKNTGLNSFRCDRYKIFQWLLSPEGITIWKHVPVFSTDRAKMLPP